MSSKINDTCTGKRISSRRSVFAWCLYDWANTAFSTVIITFIFGVYFARTMVGDETAGARSGALRLRLLVLLLLFWGRY